ncbi:phage tail protein [Fodinibius halophilus]|uniref:Phage tail protein n=1 Tax=Fodinibius halophilus TaxID=1736908 RepID=A0A6M1TPT1_9BACT|nr:tail fiber protein [Fodinibius halophilus]NGP90240.1 phage tail protein [Fodinibius halophilus]
MIDFLISAIIGWGPKWAPRGWSQCGGQQIAISQYTAVYSLIGTTYGGDGRTSFALPDLRGRAPIGYGQSPGTSHYPLGSKAGTEERTLTVLEMPSHTHTANTESLSSSVAASSETEGDSTEPGPNKVLAKGVVPQSGPNPRRDANIYVDSSKADTTIQGGDVTGSITNSTTGEGQPFSTLQPVTAINYIFCMQGIFPSRS